MTRLMNQFCSLSKAFLLFLFLVFSNNLIATEKFHNNPLEVMPCDTVYVTPEQVVDGDQVRVDFVVENFNSIISIQYSMQFDPAVLQFNSVGNFNPAMNGLALSSFNTVNSDFTTISWVDGSLAGVTLADGAVMYSLYFTPLSNATTEVFINGTPTNIEFANSDFCLVELYDGTACPDPGNCNDGNCNNGIETWDEATCSCVAGTPPTQCTDDGDCSNGQEIWNTATCSCETINIPDPSSCVDDNNCSNGDEIWNTETCSCEQLNVPNPASCVDDGNCLNGTETWDATICNCTVIPSTAGCTNPQSPNYDPNATCDNGSCDCVPDGCTDPNACNYIPTATCDNGSCTYETTCDNDPCTNGGLYVWDANSCSCTLTQPTVSGCTDSTSPNFNPAANCEDGSCACTPDGCTNPAACNYDPNATCEDGSCTFEVTCDGNPCSNGGIYSWDANSCGCVLTLPTLTGCTNPAATNYLPQATCDDGSCQFNPNGCGTVFLELQQATDGNQIRMDFVVNDFTNIVSMQYTIQYDPTTLQLQSVGNFNAGIAGITNTNFNTTAEGSIPFSWIDPSQSLQGESLPNGAVLYSLYFTELASTQHNVYINGTPTTIEISDNNQCLKDLEVTTAGGCANAINCDLDPCTNGGTYSWEATSCSCIFAQPTVSGCTNPAATNYNPQANCDDGSCQNNPNSCGTVFMALEQVVDGNQVRVDFVVDDFIDIVSMQYTIQYDATTLQVQSVGNFNSEVAGLSSANFNTNNAGAIPFAWVDPSQLLQGESLPNGAVLYSLYFTELSSTQHNVYINGSPTTIEISDNNQCFKDLVVTTSGGCSNTGPCDDGNPCTTNDVYDANCNCVGVNSETCQVNISPVLGSNDGQIRIDIVVEQFTYIASLQFSINFDGNALQLNNVGNFNPALQEMGDNNFGLFQDYVTISYADPSTSGISLANGTTIFSLYFTSLADVNSQIIVDGNPTPIEITNDQQNLISLFSVPLTVDGNDDGGNGGGNGSVDCPTSINNFTVIGELNDSKYFISNSIMTPEDLQAMAVANGGHLVTINSQDENEFIHANINEMIYIGLNDATTEGNMVWFSGEPFNYTNVNICPGCQNNNDNNDYLIMHSWDGKWSYSNLWNQRLGVIEIPCDGDAPQGCNCTAEFAPVCGSDGNTYSNACLAECEGIMTYTSGACDSGGGEGCDEVLEGFKYLGTQNGSSYYLSNGIATPTFAEEIAIDLGGHLVTINTQEENDFLFNQIDDMVYIGYNDEAAEGNLVWTSGEQSTYTNFDLCDFCLRNSENDDFIIMHSWNGKWSYSNFWNPRHFVMELPCNVTPFTKPQQKDNVKIDQVFPNPAADELFVKIQSTDEVATNLFIYDSTGQLKYNRSLQLESGNTSIQLDLNNLATGLHYLQLQDGNGNTVYRKFVKM